MTCLFLGPISLLMSPKSVILSAVSVRRTVQSTAAVVDFVERANSYFLSFSLLKVFLRFKTGFPSRKIKVGVSAVDVVALLPCREREFLYCQTQ